MSLVGYIWNKWGSVPSSPGKPARASRGCLVDSRLGVFSPSSVDWCWGALPPHTSAQKYKCSALILQFITDQLLICINLSSAGGQKSSLRPLFFRCWLVWRGQDRWTGGIFFTQPGLYTNACPCYYSFQSWYCSILLKCLCSLITVQLLGNSGEFEGGGSPTDRFV